MTPFTIHSRSLGVTFSPAGEACVRVWAPFADHIALQITGSQQTLPLNQSAPGYWHTQTNLLRPGDTYTFRLNDSLERPDPASLAQPGGVHGPSQAVDLKAFVWTDADWQNPLLDRYLIYELHTGTFSPEGTFADIEERLDHLLELGINAVQLMPVAQFPGNRNWGYDGVFPYAVQNSYGGAAGLQHLVNACHQRGLAVVLDVVYNHLGPEGNYLTSYGPYFTDRYRTPWGEGINFDGDDSANVRQYFVENVLMWLRDFHIDALRLDAVHKIQDTGDTHILREIRHYVDQLIAETGRQHYLIIESDQNETRFIRPTTSDGYGMDAQWNDEFHHALRVTAGGEKHGHYADYDGIRHLAKSYQNAYVYDGQFMPRRSKVVGSSTENHPGRQFVVFSQNHDQIGNRMLGERPSQLVSFAMQKLMAGAVLTSPYLPMLFMGEEWGETNPFLYFVSHSDAGLITAVQEGRKREFAAFQTSAEPPDPQAEQTFGQSKLRWERRTEEPHRTMFRYYQTLLALRKHPALCYPDRQSVTLSLYADQQLLFLHRRQNGQHVVCLMNFSDTTQPAALPEASRWQKLLDSNEPQWLGDTVAPDTLGPDQTVQVPPESILVYASE